MSKKTEKPEEPEFNTIREALRHVRDTMKVPKGQWNDHGKYKYRSFEDILEAAKKVAHPIGADIDPHDDIVQVGDRYYVKATLVFSYGGEKIEFSGFAREQAVQKGMNEAQITGSASSFARKYAANAMFLIDDTKDLDSDEHANETKSRGDQHDKAVAQEKAKKAAETYQSMMEQIHGFKTPEALIEWWEGKAAHVTALMRYKPQGSTTSMGEQLTASFTQKKADLMHAPAQAAE